MTADETMTICNDCGQGSRPGDVHTCSPPVLHSRTEAEAFVTAKMGVELAHHFFVGAGDLATLDARTLRHLRDALQQSADACEAWAVLRETGAVAALTADTTHTNREHP